VKITTLYDQGTAENVEDMLVLKGIDGFGEPHLIAGVVDGVSGHYDPAIGPQLFAGKTGGQLACQTVKNAVFDAEAIDSLEHIILSASQKLRAFIFAFYGIPLWKSDILPGAAFALAKIDGETIYIIQGADCFVVWRRRNGEICATANQVYSHDLEMRQMIAGLLAKHGGDRKEAWQDFMPFLSKARLNKVNKPGGYALLNGQEEVRHFWQVINLPRKETNLIVLFSDGLVPFSDTQDAQLLGEKVVELFYQGGLAAILNRTRAIEEKEKSTTHIHHAEATGIAIEL
jgi:hypothetical protein